MIRNSTMRANKSFLLILWITLDLVLLILAEDCESCGPGQRQRQVLMDIYESTNGNGWLRKDSWNSSTEGECSHCTWYGITCRCGTITCTTWCAVVTEIVLPDNNLTGTLPGTLGNLRQLETLALNSNKDLKGKLDDFLSGNMTNLEKIDLSFCGFSGKITESIAKFKKLRVLGLGENYFTGPLPYGIGALTNLEVLDLENVNIKSRFDIFSNLTNLLSLNLSKTELLGELPSNIGKLFPNMLELLLPGNRLNGSIPDSIGTMKSLTRLSLANNELSGAIPGNITKKSKLTFIDLSENNYSSIRENNYSLISDNLEILVLSGNPQLSVNLRHFLNRKPPQTFLTKLSVLIISNCQFYGEVPKSIWSYGNLIYVDVRNNSLSGRLPDVHTPMYSLLHLDVSHNPALEGPIPSTLSRIESLHKLDIRGNKNMIGCRINENKSICNATLSNNGIEIDYRSMYELNDKHCSCPSALLKVTKGLLFLNPKYYGYTFCRCDPGYYGEGIRCRQCLEGGKCLGNNHIHMTIRKGYWPEPNPENVTQLTRCSNNAHFFSDKRLSNCNPNGNCTCILRTSNTTTCRPSCLCRNGSFDRLCSRCQEKWYKSGNICRRCPSHHHATYIFIGVLLATIFVFIVALLCLKSRPRLSLLVIYGQFTILFSLRCANLIPGWVFEFNAIILLFYLAGMGNSSKGILKIAVFYFQILDAMLSTYKLWPKEILQGQQYVSSIINFHFPGLMCDIPELYTPTGQFVSVILLPVICICMTWLFYSLVWMAYKIGAHSWNILSIKYHCLQITVTCLNLTYFPIVLRSIAVLASCQDRVMPYMRIAPWISCVDSPTSSFLQSLAWLSTFVYVIGVPLFVFFPLLLCYVRANKRSELTEHEKEAMDKWLGSIYLPYKEKYRSFCEVYALLRKLLLAFMIGYIPEVSSLQTFFVSLVLTAALTCHLVWQPYQSSLGWIPIENILETIILVVLQHSFILLRFTSVEKRLKRVTLLWIIVAVNCLVVFLLIVIISVLLANRAAKSLKSRLKIENRKTVRFGNGGLLRPLLLMREDEKGTEDN